MKLFAILLIVGVFVSVHTLESESSQDKSAILNNQESVSSTTTGPSTTGQNPNPAGIPTADKVNTLPCPPGPAPVKGIKDCTREYKPICSSSGQTYNNQCEFENAQMRDSTLTMTRTGTC